MSKVIPIHRPRNQTFTICIDCVHFLNKEPGTPREDAPYNHLCTAATLPVRQDPYDGKLKPYTTNGLGDEYFSPNIYEFCSKINDGNCPYFTTESAFQNRTKDPDPSLTSKILGALISISQRYREE